MNCLELFSGTHSIGNVLKKKGHNVLSLDLKDADINCDILEWDYKVYQPNHFDYIHASPPCDTFSICRKCWIGRKIKAHGDKIITMDILLKDQQEIGIPILNKTLEIIKYFNPTYFTIENPTSGDMKKYITDLSFTDVDYCMYGFPYRKRTRIWNNFNFVGEKCNKKCGNFFAGKHKQDAALHIHLKERYRIPEKLIESWINFFNLGITN